MRLRLFPLMLLVFGAGYVAAVTWVFLRSTPMMGGRPVTIRISHWQIEKGPPDGLAAVIREYERTHPRVKVEQVKVPGPIYRQWLRTNLTGRTATDLVEFAYFLGAMGDVPVRYFEPLTRLMTEPNPYNRGTAMEKVPWRLTFADGLYFMISQSPEIGQVYGATLTQGSSRLFCNRELLEKILGGPAVAPETFEDFRRLCARIDEYSKRTGHKVYPMAGAGFGGNMQWIADYLMIGTVSGLNLALDREGYLSRSPWQSQSDYLQGRWTYRRPELRAGFGLLRDVSLQMRPGFFQLSRDSAIQEFVRGDALSIYAGSFDATSLKRLAPFPVMAMRVPQPAKDDPVVGPYILGRYSDGYVGTGMEIYLNKDSPHKAEALDFLHFLTSVQGGQLFQDNSGWLSSVREVKVPPDLEIYRASGDGYTTGTQYIGVGAASTMSFWQNFHLLTGPQGSVDQFVEALEKEMPKQVTADLRQEVHTLTEAVGAVDSEIVAVNSLNRLSGPNADRDLRLRVLASNQTLSEISKLEATWVLERRGVDLPSR